MANQTSDMPGSGYGNPYIDSLVWGCKWTDGPVTYWLDSGPVVDRNWGAFLAADWSAKETALFTTAMSAYSAVCNITFAVADSEADANIVWRLAPRTAMSVSRGEQEAPTGQYDQIFGDFNYQDYHNQWSELQVGSRSFTLVLHEIGHGLGLAHPHDGGDEIDRSVFPGVTGATSLGTYGLNKAMWTVMSYNDDYTLSSTSPSAYGFQATPMAFDIAALQAIYGRNMDTNADDTTYYLPKVNAAGNWPTTEGTSWKCIWDAGGTDTISNQGSTIACTINLNDAPLTGANAGGFLSQDAGIMGGFTIANGVTIENAVGGSGADRLVGFVVVFWFDGGAGKDS